MKRAVTVLAVLAVLILAGAFAYKHFVTDQIMDRGGMENPDIAEEPVALDGDGTYVDNEALLEELRGTWTGNDGHYTLTIRDEGDMALSLEGETILEDTLRFTYILPEDASETELTLTADTIRGKAIEGFVHQAGENSGTLLLELSGETITFYKTGD